MHNETRDAIKQLGWSHKRLADFLSEVTGDHVPKSTVDAWLTANRQARYARSCPGWPLAMLRLAGYIE